MLQPIIILEMISFLWIINNNEQSYWKEYSVRGDKQRTTRQGKEYAIKIEISK